MKKINKKHCIFYTKYIKKDDKKYYSQNLETMQKLYHASYKIRGMS